MFSASVRRQTSGGDAYSLRDVVNHYCAVCVPVVHWCERLVALLAGRVPYLKLDGRSLVEGDGLGEESGADGRLPIVIELVLLQPVSYIPGSEKSVVMYLNKAQDEGALNPVVS